MARQKRRFIPFGKKRNTSRKRILAKGKKTTGVKVRYYGPKGETVTLSKTKFNKERKAENVIRGRSGHWELNYN